MTFRMGLFVLLPIALLIQSASAQIISNSSQWDREMLKLRGDVKEIRLLENDRNKIKFSLKLSLNIVNEGYRPVILLKQDFFIGTEKLARSCEDAKAQQYLYTSRAWPSVSGDVAWSRWRKELDSDVPNEKKLWIMSAGESVQFDTSTVLYIEKNGNFDRTNKPWAEIQQSATLCLQVEIQSWPVNLEPNHDLENPEFGQRLREKWEAYGRLQLKHLISEPIEISLLPTPPLSVENKNSGMLRIGPEVEAHLLIYFVNTVTQDQINNFSKDVLSTADPRDRGDALPPGVETFLRIDPPVQGHEGVAIRFERNATDAQRRKLLNFIKAAPIVYRVLENRAPNSVKNLEK